MSGVSSASGDSLSDSPLCAALAAQKEYLELRQALSQSLKSLLEDGAETPQISPEEAAELASAEAAEDQEAMARWLLRPGATLSGSISIPGATEGLDREPYRLTVLEGDAKESRSSSQLLCIHSAYNDEQVCDLEFEATANGAVEVRWQDAETACRGTIDLATRSLRGCVAQLKFVEEGFYYPSDDVTHTFHLVFEGLAGKCSS
eukprot:TRINITY_DN7928_c0_g5_i2.p1 TRINITY_DN7928_c0_g5~~TRINITY_DN7928_c0_g5_i2.p1  ORF type:complete len:237 (-),score=53.11 TRINITY_DN7928_c0_g5_i2:74-685(-)